MGNVQGFSKTRPTANTDRSAFREWSNGAVLRGYARGGICDISQRAQHPMVGRCLHRVFVSQVGQGIFCLKEQNSTILEFDSSVAELTACDCNDNKYASTKEAKDGNDVINID